VEEHPNCNYTILILVGGNSSDTLKDHLLMSKITKFLMFKVEEIKKQAQYKYGRKMDLRLKLGRLSMLKMLQRSKLKD
jgi:hypothetical protein